MKCNLSACTRNTINGIIALFIVQAIPYRNFCNDQFFGIRLVYPHRRNRLLYADQTLINGKGTYRGRYVATVALIADLRFVNGDLTEVIVHIIIRIP